MDETLYFTYGSNINLNQMAHRCPAAQVVGPVALEGYELLFRGNAGGTGVATIAPREGGTVHGLLWTITPECERALDRYEGYPNFYGKEPVTVRDKSGEKITVMAYVMTVGDWWRDPAPPSLDYYLGIQEGYRQNGLPLAPLNKALEHLRDEVQEIINCNCSPHSRPSGNQQNHSTPKKKGKPDFER